MQVSLWKHRAYSQGCCNSCFYVKGYTFVFTFNYLGFFNKNNFNQVKLVTV